LKAAKVKTIFGRSVGQFRSTGRSVTISVKINHSNSNYISFEFNLLRTTITEDGTYGGTFFFSFFRFAVIELCRALEH